MGSNPRMIIDRVVSTYTLACARAIAWGENRWGGFVRSQKGAPKSHSHTSASGALASKRRSSHRVRRCQGGTMCCLGVGPVCSEPSPASAKLSAAGRSNGWKTGLEVPMRRVQSRF